MATLYEKQRYAEAGTLSLASSSGTVTGDFCEIYCIGTTTFSTLTDTLEKTTAEYGTKASGTLTFTGLPVANETFVVHGITYTMKASAASATQVTIGADATATAVNVAAVVAANDTAVTAANVAGVVTFTAVARGTGGNAFTLTEALTNATVSGSGTFAGGKDLTAASAISYPHGSVLRGKFTAISLAGGNARVTVSSPP